MILDRLPPRSEWLQLVRYYVAAAINLMFGYLLFAGLVWAGLQVFVAQALGYVVGVMFNYVTYDRIAFSDKHGSKIVFVLAYVVNYLTGVALLWLALRVVYSPYIAGFFAAVVLSIFNYFVLRKWVFRTSAKPSRGQSA